jgi:hypothetical protein
MTPEMKTYYKIINKSICAIQWAFKHQVCCIVDDNGNAPGTRYLMYVNLDTITNYRCRSLMGWNSVFNTNLCAGAIQGGGKDTCQVII